MCGRAREQRATTNQGVGNRVRESRMRPIKCRRPLAVGVRSTPSLFSVARGGGSLMLASPTTCPFVNEAAHCSFNAERLHSNECSCVCAVGVCPPSTFLWLGTAAFLCLPSPASQLEIVPISKRGREGWSSVVSCPGLLVSVTQGYK